MRSGPFNFQTSRRERVNRQPAMRHAAFTLVELLIVMAIIVLAMTLTVPAIRALSGSRSEQSAQNTISAFLATARAEAIGLQRTQGVMFYIDPATDRVTAAQVYSTPLITAGNPDIAGLVYLDLVPDHDPLPLPSGIRLRVLKSIAPPPVGPVTFFPNDRYLGYNIVGSQLTTSNINTAPPPGHSTTLMGGVILFDAQGRVTTPLYVYRSITADATGKIQMTAMSQLDGVVCTSVGSPYNRDSDTWTQGIHSGVGFVMFDRESFLNQGFSDSNGQPNDAAAEQWLDANATPVLVNRYNGTLTRAE